MIEINKKMNGSEVEVVVGEPFEVRLHENPTTGYRWRFCSSGTPTVELQEDSFQPPEGPPGAGGTHHWRFHPVQEGTAELQMDYQRGWEKQAAETFRVTVRVKPR